MKVSLEGLIANASEALRCSRDSYGPMYAYALGELRDHIKGLVDGRYTIEEFAEHYCISANRSGTMTAPADPPTHG